MAYPIKMKDNVFKRLLSILIDGIPLEAMIIGLTRRKTDDIKKANEPMIDNILFFKCINMKEMMKNAKNSIIVKPL